MGDEHFAKASEHFGAQGTGYIGHEAENAQRCKAHNQLYYLGDSSIAIFKEFVQAFLSRTTAGQHSNGHAQEQREDNYLQNVKGSKGAKYVIREPFYKAVDNANPLSAEGCFFAQLNTHAGFNNIGPNMLNLNDAKDIFMKRKGGPVSKPKNDRPFTLSVIEKLNAKPSAFRESSEMCVLEVND